MMQVLAKMVIIVQYRQTANQNIIYTKLTQCYMSVISP